MKTVLVTGFGAFPGAPSNPTLAILARLERDWGRALARAGLDLRTACLPVAYEGAEERIGALIADARPDVVLHLGLAGRRRTLTFETRARNRLNTIHPDGARRLADRPHVAPGGPMSLRVRAPVARAVAAMARSGAPCRPSVDAGDYLCNQTLYASLSTAQPVVAFLHVPRPSLRRTPLPAMVRAVVAALRVLARETSRIPPVKTRQFD